MFSLDNSLRYWFYSKPTDMRKSFYTLGGLVRNDMGLDPRNGDVYIFVNLRRNRMKLLHMEERGLALYSKMLDRGSFKLLFKSYDSDISLIDLAALHDIIKGVKTDRYSRLNDLRGH